MNYNIRKVQLVVFAVALSAILTANQVYGEQWENVKPSSGVKADLKINGKTRTYWKLEKKKATEIKLVGPAKLKVISRASIPKGKKEVVYGFISKENGTDRNLIGRGTSLAKNVSNPKEQAEKIGESRTIIYSVPDGEHSYTFALPEDQVSDVYLRFFVTAVQSENIPYIAYLPQSYPKEARITVNEREYIYYRVNKDQRVELDLIGPTQIKGISRLEYDNTMHGEKAYRVQVLNDNKIVVTEPFMSAISATASFVETVDRKVGKGDVFYINVPKGRHKYYVTTPDQGAVVYLRFYIPQNDLGNHMPVGGSDQNNFANFVRGMIE